jgi:hypothetical protein
MGVSANIRSLPQSAPIMLPQTTDHSTDQEGEELDTDTGMLLDGEEPDTDTGTLL